MGYEIKPYEARDGFRWRMVASNNRIVADSAESYATEKNVDRAIAKLEENLGLARVDREQFLVIRRQHWDEAVDDLLNNFPNDDDRKQLDRFLSLVADAAV